jgi:hypothetical protein
MDEKLKIIFMGGAEGLNKEEKEKIYRLFKDKEEKLIRLGIKTVEIDSIAGFWFRNIKKARFIPLTITHLARLLKK